MSTDITVINNNALAVPEDIMGITGMDSVRIRPANITLVQNTTQEVYTARPGQFLDSLTHEVWDEITVVPLKVIPNRVMFPPGTFGGAGGEPICRSNDGVYPSPYAKAPQAESCATCPNSRWVNKKKPACSERKKLLAVIKETGIPRYIQFGGLGVRVLNETLEAIKQDMIVMYKKDGSKFPLYSYYFTLKSQREVGPQGVYYVYRIEGLRKMQDASEFGPLFVEYVMNARHTETEDQESEAEAKVDSAVGTVIEAQVVNDAPPFDV